jgi:hypothetical protein
MTSPSRARLARSATLLTVLALLLAPAAASAQGGISVFIGSPTIPSLGEAGFPNATNTGVPAGTTLTTVSGDLTVTTNNSTVDSKNVTGCIVVNATGVTVKNSKAQCITTAFNAAARNPANPRLTIQDSEDDCGNTAGSTAISDRNVTVLRVNIHGCENGFDADSDFTIQDSYIHDLYNSAVGDPHTDGLQSAVGSNMVIDHNTFYGFDTGCAFPNGGSCNGTSAINVNNSAGGPTSTNTSINNNLLAGGAFTLYCPIPATSSFSVTNNHFSTVYSSIIGEFGPSSDCSSNETLSGNVYHETGLPITLS